MCFLETFKSTLLKEVFRNPVVYFPKAHSLRSTALGHRKIKYSVNNILQIIYSRQTYSVLLNWMQPCTSWYKEGMKQPCRSDYRPFCHLYRLQARSWDRQLTLLPVGLQIIRFLPPDWRMLDVFLKDGITFTYVHCAKVSATAMNLIFNWLFSW